MGCVESKSFALCWPWLSSEAPMFFTEDPEVIWILTNVTTLPLASRFHGCLTTETLWSIQFPLKRNTLTNLIPTFSVKSGFRKGAREYDSVLYHSMPSFMCRSTQPALARLMLWLGSVCLEDLCQYCTTILDDPGRCLVRTMEKIRAQSGPTRICNEMHGFFEYEVTRSEQHLKIKTVSRQRMSSFVNDTNSLMRLVWSISKVMIQSHGRRGPEFSAQMWMSNMSSTVAPRRASTMGLIVTWTWYTNLILTSSELPSPDYAASGQRQNKNHNIESQNKLQTTSSYERSAVFGCLVSTGRLLAKWLVLATDLVGQETWLHFHQEDLGTPLF